ncbi:MAG: flagellar motor switch protein FliN [Peredibacter sp.]|nr:flagellar motor switch protein FliN [Peredibacter sp.]|tara:strand:+ start:1489 stop:1863 length:375 start_codon:yes stop_codon:yes gene_type:complete
MEENNTENQNDMNQDQKDAIAQLADQIKTGDDALNKLKVQNLDFILDIPLKVSVELGRASVVIKDLLQLGQGSVLELDKLAGEPLEVLVNGKLVARGEVVVVNEKFGIRLTDIISPLERIETLK